MSKITADDKDFQKWCKDVDPNNQIPKEKLLKDYNMIAAATMTRGGDDSGSSDYTESLSSEGEYDMSDHDSGDDEEPKSEIQKPRGVSPAPDKNNNQPSF